MKLVTWRNSGGASSLGCIASDGKILDLKQAAKTLEDGAVPAFGSMLSLIQAGEAALDKARGVAERAAAQGEEAWYHPYDPKKLLAPLPAPESVRDAMAFEDHIINCIRAVGLKKLGALDEKLEKRWGRRATLARFINRAWYDRPLYYKSNRFSVVGPEFEVAIPSYCQTFDYELELGVVLGKRGTNIKASKVDAYIFGYTLFNDFSARDAQLKEMKGRLGPAKGKDFNGGNAMGPMLVTTDELDVEKGISLEARVNGERWSRGNTSEMYWSFGEIIEAISKDETLYPGEFIGSGTCSGTEGRGCGLEMGRFLQRGDVVELSGEGLGTLRNSVV